MKCKHPFFNARNLGKLLGSVLLLGFLLHKVDVPSVWSSASTTGLMPLALACLAACGALVFSALRWQVLLAHLGRAMPWAQLVQVYWLGAFFSQIMPGSVSGDVVRAWCARKLLPRPADAAVSVLSDRLIGLGVQIYLCAGAFILAPLHNPDLLKARWIFAALACGYMATVLAGCLLQPARLFKKLHRVHRLMVHVQDAMKRTYSTPGTLALAVICSLAVQGCSMLMFTALARGLGLHLGLFAICGIWPATTLLTIIPLTFAGWGIREGALVFLLGQLGVTAHSALALSMLSGGSLLATSLPGGLSMLPFFRNNYIKGHTYAH